MLAFQIFNHTLACYPSRISYNILNASTHSALLSWQELTIQNLEAFLLSVMSLIKNIRMPSLKIIKTHSEMSFQLFN